MIAKILIGLAILLGVFALVVAMQPAEFRVARDITVMAPPTAVFSQVNDFHRWDTWSPWAKLDPAMKQTYAGTPAGTGAVYSWAGNSKVGEGRMTILESRPNELVRIKLEFLKPFHATNTTDFTFKPAGTQTAVAWIMTGKNNFFAKAFSLFVNMDKMVGADFEKGLVALKAVAESSARP